MEWRRCAVIIFCFSDDDGINFCKESFMPVVFGRVGMRPKWFLMA